MITNREIEKLKVIGYTVEFEYGKWWAAHPTYPAVKGRFSGFRPRSHIPEPQRTEEVVAWMWEACRENAKQPHIMVATMAAKVRWLGGIEVWEVDGGWRCGDNEIPGRGDSPETAVDALFWKVS